MKGETPKIYSWRRSFIYDSPKSCNPIVCRSRGRFVSWQSQCLFQSEQRLLLQTKDMVTSVTGTEEVLETTTASVKALKTPLRSRWIESWVSHFVLHPCNSISKALKWLFSFYFFLQALSVMPLSLFWKMKPLNPDDNYLNRRRQHSTVRVRKWTRVQFLFSFWKSFGELVAE